MIHPKGIVAMKRLRPTAIALVLTAAACGAQAHNLWLLPSTTVLSKADWITVDAAVSNDLFFFNHVPLGLDRLTVTAPDGSAAQPENLAKGKLRSTFDLHLTQTGTYRIAVLTEGGFARWQDKASGQPKRARVNADNFAAQVPADAQELEVTQAQGRIETFATVGKPSALQASGKGLELVTLATSPTDLVQGETAQFALQLDGQPAQGIEVTITPGNTRYRDQLGEIKLKTDAQGRFRVTWPQAGMYWLEAAAQDDRVTLPRAKSRRSSYAATLEVLP
jgi:uncharacterized GH25 family protein